MSVKARTSNVLAWVQLTTAAGIVITLMYSLVVWGLEFNLSEYDKQAGAISLEFLADFSDMPSKETFIRWKLQKEKKIQGRILEVRKSICEDGLKRDAGTNGAEKSCKTSSEKNEMVLSLAIAYSDALQLWKRKEKEQMLEALKLFGSRSEILLGSFVAWLALGIINYIWVGSFRFLPWKRLSA